MFESKERRKQRKEIQAWIRIAREEGPSFMEGAEPRGDLTPYEDRVVVDVGCGPRPYVERLPTRLAFMVDCCMLGYLQEGLLNESSIARVCCVDAMAERLPFRSGSVDVILAINMLDHTLDPPRVVDEFDRVLRPAGTLHLHVDIGGKPNACEPVVFTEAALDELLSRFRPTWRATGEPSNPSRHHRVMIALAKEGARGDEEEVDARDYLDVLVSPDTGGRLERRGERLVTEGGRPEYEIVGGVFVLRPRRGT